MLTINSFLEQLGIVAAPVVVGCVIIGLLSLLYGHVREVCREEGGA